MSASRLQHRQSLTPPACLSCALLHISAGPPPRPPGPPPRPGQAHGLPGQTHGLPSQALEASAAAAAPMPHQSLPGPPHPVPSAAPGVAAHHQGHDQVQASYQNQGHYNGAATEGQAFPYPPPPQLQPTAAAAHHHEQPGAPGMHDHAHDQHPAHADTSADADAPSSTAVPAQAQPQASGQAAQPEGPPAPELLKRLRASYSAKPQHYQKPPTHLGAPGADCEAPPGMEEAAGTQLGVPGHGHASDAASSESAPGTDDTEGPPGTEAAPKRELPAALKARLMARGILKQGSEAGTTADRKSVV